MWDYLKSFEVRVYLTMFILFIGLVDSIYRQGKAIDNLQRQIDELTGEGQ